jgi:hypothetical protein
MLLSLPIAFPLNRGTPSEDDDPVGHHRWKWRDARIAGVSYISSPSMTSSISPRKRSPSVPARNESEAFTAKIRRP